MNKTEGYPPIRKRNQTLVIVEGKAEKEELLRVLFKAYPEMKINMQNVLIYDTDIYDLYHLIISEYPEDWESQDIDLPFIISKKHKLDREIYQKRNFTNIYMIFDYERQDNFFSSEAIIQMQKYFADETDMGLLFINYPMVEAYKDFNGLPPEEEFYSKSIGAGISSGKEYKRSVNDSPIARRIRIPQRIDQILMERFLISDKTKREAVASIILSVTSSEELKEDINTELLDVISVEEANQLFHQISSVLQDYRFWDSKEDYYKHMRYVFSQIIRQNIIKAWWIQSGLLEESTELSKLFNQLDFLEILQAQNTFSSDIEAGGIWVLALCVLLVPQYNSGLI